MGENFSSWHSAFPQVTFRFSSIAYASFWKRISVLPDHVLRINVFWRINYEVTEHFCFIWNLNNYTHSFQTFAIIIQERNKGVVFSQIGMLKICQSSIYLFSDTVHFKSVWKHCSDFVSLNEIVPCTVKANNVFSSFLSTFYSLFL